MKSQLRCSVIGAIRIDSNTGAVRGIVILEPGFYFRIGELANGTMAPAGRVWIRHENCGCYEVSECVLAETSVFEPHWQVPAQTGQAATNPASLI